MFMRFSKCVPGKAQWLSWLERRPVTAEVRGPSPLWVAATKVKNGVLAQLGEHLPYKQGVTGSSPVGPISYKISIFFFYADVAQLAEQLICNQQVNGSSPLIGSELYNFIRLMDGFPSGQRGQTVNLLAMPSKVRILPHPVNGSFPLCFKYRGVEQSGSSSGS